MCIKFIDSKDEETYKSIGKSSKHTSNQARNYWKSYEQLIHASCILDKTSDPDTPNTLRHLSTQTSCFIKKKEEKKIKTEHAVLPKESLKHRASSTPVEQNLHTYYPSTHTHTHWNKQYVQELKSLHVCVRGHRSNFKIHNITNWQRNILIQCKYLFYPKY